MSSHFIGFDVTGINPEPQGSKNAFVVGKRAVVVEANKRLPAFRQAVSQKAKETMELEGKEVIHEGPVKVSVVFMFPRLKSHFNSKGQIKDSAPRWKSTGFDLDKLCRAVGDSMTGFVYRDDSQVVRWDALKVYDDYPGTSIIVYSL
jgi:Holliday junction resolvase RusA-like endonuclease